MAKIYTMGEMLVEIMRERNDVPLEQPGVFLGPYPSGAPAIFISTVGQLGHQAKIWGGVGQDKFGTVLLDRLKTDQVNCDDVFIDSAGSTAAAFVAYDQQGDREFIFHIAGTPAANVKFIGNADDIPDFFHVMGCSLMASDALRQSITAAVEFFAAHHSRISFDPNIRMELLKEQSIDDVTGRIMAHCTIFLPGIKELKLFSNKPNVASCVQDLFERYPKLEIINVKNGSKGSAIYTREQTVSVPVYPIEQVKKIIDPTGAGDSYDAAFLCGIADGMPLGNAAAYAAKAGAINSIAFGPMSGDMSLMQEDLIGDNKKEQHE
jgi:sugar/nucleoside kinase (ribokinase family)